MVNFRTYLHIALLHPEQPAVLMLPVEHGWALPHMQGAGRPSLWPIDAINQLMRHLR